MGYAPAQGLGSGPTDVENVAGLGVGTTLTAPEVFAVDASQTIASATGASWDGVHVRTSTATLTGSTSPITELDLFTIEAPVITSGSAITVSTAATLKIEGPPTAGGSTTITTPYSLYVATGSSAFGGSILSTSTTAYSTALRLGAAQSITYDAANSTGLMNGTTAQTFSVYNTYTAGTPDSEQLIFSWLSSVATISTQKSGTGTARALQIRQGGTTSPLITVGTLVNKGVILGTGGGSTAATNGMVIMLGDASQWSQLSGTAVGVEVNTILLDGGSTSSTVWHTYRIAPTINYTAAAKTGKVNLIYLAPTLTSLPSGNNGGIVFSSAFMNAATIPGIVFHGVADEVTNTEQTTFQYVSSVFTINSKKTGSGTIRPITIQTGSTGGWTLDASNILFPAGTLATNMTTGFLNIPGAAGAPSGAPASTTGFSLYWDSTNKKLYVYSGAAWLKGQVTAVDVIYA